MDSSSPNIRTGYRLKFYDALPLTTAGLILVLYALAYSKAMEHIVFFIAFYTAYLMIRAIKSKWRPAADTVTDVAAFVIISVTVSLLIKDHVVKWWDDVNFWATDAKGLYYLSGFTGKYGNVAPEFGDYPPAIQIAKWCALKFSLNEYREGYAFVGYSLMNMIFLLPLMRVADKVTAGLNRVLSAALRIVWMTVIMLIPGIVNDVWSYGACADVTMGIVYGAMLMAIYEVICGDNDRPEFIPYLKVALYGCVTALCKNTGFMWVTFAMILFIVLTIRMKRPFKNTLLTALCIYLIQGSWWANCLINRRIAKLTGALARTATGGMSMPEDASDKLRYYLLGFIKEPMHTAHTPVLDISALAMFIILTAVGVVTILSGKRDGSGLGRTPAHKIMIVYTVLSGMAIYVIVLMSHMSIFATETQYGSSEVMAISISRYGAPFTIGTLMLLLCVMFDGMKTDRRVIISFAAAVLLIILTTDYPAYGYMLRGYMADRDADLKARADMIDQEGQMYIDYLNSLSKDEYDEIKGHRVLFMRDGSRIHWVNDTYINYAVAPIATVYASYEADMSEEDVANIVKTSHADYIYYAGEKISPAY
ncbi:MAG: hypothetical protein IKQ83_07510 [Lachnospiraceae bacterium]|nr:hypothetical protein [Lachnospiraceae bacterium]